MIIRIQKLLLRVVSAMILVVSIVAPLGVIYMFGFPQDAKTVEYINTGYKSMLMIVWLALTVRLIIDERQIQKKPNWPLTAVYVALSIVAIFNIALRYNWLSPDKFLGTISAPGVVIVSLLVVSAVELSKAVSTLMSRKINPSSILAGSFLIIILIGSLLLMLPNCTHHKIEYIDALFTSASAVCVTGLTVLGTHDTFTLTGQIIILLLIQIGGLGIMTITSFFSLFFMGQTSLRSQLQLSDMLSGEMMGGLGRTLLKIIFVTLAIEGIGAVMLYMVVTAGGVFVHEGQSIFFGIFHSISAFCNAGFSTLEGNLYNPAVRHLWGIPTIISWLVIFGGLGFPIFSNILSIAAHSIGNAMRRVAHRAPIRRPRLWSLNSYIVLRTTAILLLGAWAFILVVEWNHSLAEFSFMGKLSQGFLAAVTPRTAGFNGVNMQSMLPATLILTTLLMWIGGAPQSTAGGIKVTTLYLAIKNISATIRGNAAIEVDNREIPVGSLRRAFAVIALSIGTLSVSIILLSIFEPTISVGNLIFEAVSAISTVGLGLGITPELSAPSKIVIITLMYVGRVGLIGIVAAMVKRDDIHPYTLPQEDILIN